jgi:hypothetical protein
MDELDQAMSWREICLRFGQEQDAGTSHPTTALSSMASVVSAEQ